MPINNLKKHRNKLQKGFTLIELLVVVSVIGMLSSITMVATASATRGARDARRAGDVRGLNQALELFFSDNNSYPRSRADVNAIGPVYSHNAEWESVLGAQLDPYIKNMPKDPINLFSTYANPRPYSNVYQYYDRPISIAGSTCVSSTNGNMAVILYPGSYYMNVPTENTQVYGVSDGGVNDRYVEYFGGNYQRHTSSTCP